MIWTVFSLVWKTSIFVGFSVCFIENLELLSKVFNLILVIFFYVPIITRAGTAFHSSQNVINDEVTNIMPGMKTVVK